ncbi:ligase-associated DNA damage response endonuclease PdeM [Devosia sp. YIM 151766]|uniref:ligase-associated DNA damage response endonuclease PdeM n=1 Tax=Devosia sp. YIM 151766 TaxID=3017325 RepID=UPI00255CCF4B|nr:ligase-associated DNA damage response endonuclease PdeM [Devosia sp. YIM 151766]WIY53298.1 ligase-associated DNA damage response endonuclease PdeM [Devosia sp. YIM 151766]
MNNSALAEPVPENPLLRFAGHNFEPLPSGALYWRARETLLVADLHFEKMASFARRGQMLPPYDTGLTLTRLEFDLRRTGARTLLSLGDTFHRVDASSLLTNADRMRLDAIVESVDCIWLSGNHDPAPHAIGGACLPELDLDGLLFTHEPRKGKTGLISGHLHPAARLAMPGRSTRKPCFVHDNRLLILPAYGSSTGAINILGPAFIGLFHWPALEVTMLGRDRTYPVPVKRLVAG